FTDRVPELLAAADLLVSPVRYEAYGLNVQEALCRGLPVVVSGRAGIAERFEADLADMVLPDPEDAAELARRLARWRAAGEEWKRRVQPLGAVLRRRTWREMAHEIVERVESAGGRASPPAGPPQAHPELQPR
ncbi:MAG TPA: glycosyltransferase, partial [Longimicrobiaceae bacterium]|nr:glycosyltransferase [Longimicrobiaceae bacterium]